MATKNIFAKIGADDSDDDFEPKPMTKTTKKKEERKIADKETAVPQGKPKVNTKQMEEGGFEMEKSTNRGGKRP